MPYHVFGELEDEGIKIFPSNDKNSRISEVDSLANSSCYNKLVEDLHSFTITNFLEHDREKREIEKTLKINPDAPVPYRKDSAKAPVDINRFE